MNHRLLPLSLLLAAAAPAQFVPDVVTYLDASPTTHQLQFSQLSGQGYRPISLCVAGGMATARYSAVWIRRSGATFVAVHGVDATAYTTWRNQQKLAGYRPLLVTTAGASAADTVYAGVWVRDGVDAVEEVEQYSYQHAAKNTWAYANDYALTCCSVRGTSVGSFIAGVWEKNRYQDGWCWAQSTAAGYSADFNARVDGFGRLVSAQTTPAGSISQVWRDDAIGGWLTLPGLTTAQLQTEITNRKPSGYYPTSIQATGTGSSARFHVVFATRDLPMTRTLTKTGLAVIPMAGFDQYMEDHMNAHGIRASSIAITKDGRLVFARGYTLAESGYPATQPTSLFRIASSTKTLTGLCTNLLIQRGAITANTLAGSYLALPGYDQRFDQIRVHHLLAHRAGVYSDNTSWGVANWLSSTNPQLPVSSWNTARFTAGTSMRTTPGTDYLYANVGYYLLGSLIERASGKTYERFLREDLAAPMGVTRIWVGANERSQLRSDEVEYRNRFLELTPSELYTDRRTVPVQFGGGGDDNLTRRAAAGGVITSPVDYVRIFAGSFDMVCDGGVFTQTTLNSMLAAPLTSPGANPCGFDSREVRANGVVALGKNGQLWGSSTEVIYRTDGVAIAVFDGKQNSNASRTTLNNLADAVTTWPTHDLFPNYGLPAFQRVCPRAYGVQNPSLPNLGDAAFVVDGDVLSTVDRIDFGRSSITSRSSTTWVDGWFRIVSNNQIEVYPPQGLVPGSYQLVLRNGNLASQPQSVTLTRQTASFLGAPSTSFASYEVIAARGPASIGSVALLCFSDSNVPSVAAGIVSLGIGNRFATLGTWPVAIPFNLLTGCASWTLPRAAGLWYFQAAIADPNASQPLPLPVTNVRSVRAY